jgi:uncharacterized protein (TIGR00290 family)
VQRKIVLSWSGGKDSVLALAALQAEGWQAIALVSGILEDERKLVMHEVPEELIAAQAHALALPFAPFYLPRNAPNALYEARLLDCLGLFAERGVAAIAFGDLFLEDIRSYRERLLGAIGLQPVFPIWNRDSRALIRSFLDQGYRAIAVCVDAQALDASFAGAPIDDKFIARLPSSVDPSGENGEFHTFVFDGPLFRQPVRFSREQVTRRGEFYYCDLKPT